MIFLVSLSTKDPDISFRPTVEVLVNRNHSASKRNCSAVGMMPTRSSYGEGKMEDLRGGSSNESRNG